MSTRGPTTVDAPGSTTDVPPGRETERSQELADTLAEHSEGHRVPDIEYARVKNLVRGGLFGRDAVPVRIGRFAILRRVGSGGMSVVYSAFDDELDRKVAIKLLRPNPNAPGAGARLRREAQAIARLSHPNVIPVYEVGEHRGELFVAMEFVRGKTLRAWMDEDVRPRAHVQDLMLQAGAGLDAAHRAGIVHRDFKPENVMIGDDGRVRVLDFGVAALERDRAPTRRTSSASQDRAGESEHHLTHDGTLLGTPAYMSPEALAGERVDVRADQFSFCLTYWEALSGRRPFAGGSLQERLAAIAAGPRGHLDVPARTRAALRRGLSESADERWPDMHTLLNQLTPRRRSVATGIAVAVAATGVAAVGLAHALRPTDDACGNAPEALADVWGPDRHRDATAALSNADEPVALGAWTAAQSSLDGYAAAWLEAREHSCAQDPQEGERALQREMCFAWTLGDLQAVVAPLLDGETAAVERTSAELGKLPSPAECRDPAKVSRLLEARARRTAPAPEGASDGVFSDFEGARWSRFGAGWATSTDLFVGGRSHAEMDHVDEGVHGSAHALRIRGSVAIPLADVPAWGGAMVFLGETPFAPANLMSKSRLSFWARGEPGPHAVMLFTSSGGFDPVVAPFELTPEWKQHTFDLDTLLPERFDVTSTFVGAVTPGPFDVTIDDFDFR